MTANLQFDACIGYKETQIFMVSSDCVANICANGIRLYNITSKKTDYIWSPVSNTITVATFSTFGKCIAFATSGPKPLIFLYNYPERTLRTTLKGETNLEYVALDLSMDGQVLIALGGYHDCDLSYFDLTTNALKPGGHVPLPHLCNKISFNPFSNTDFCTSGDKGIYFWKITDQFETHDIVSVPGLIKDLVVENVEGRLPTKPEELVRIQTHAWTQEKDVIAAVMDKSELYIFDPATGAVKETIFLEDDVLCTQIIITTNYFVLSCSDSKIRWVSLVDTHSIDGMVTLNEMQSNIVSMTYTLDYQRLLGLCANGTLYSCNLQLLPPSTPSGKRKAVDQTKKMNLKILESHHVGGILCGTFVRLEGGDNVIVTGSEDGALRAWGSTQYESIQYEFVNLVVNYI